VSSTLRSRWLERSTTLSPNYAQGVYACAWTETLAGRGIAGREHVDLAMRLSPLDPLHYAMLGTRALSHLQLAEDAAAAHWGRTGRARTWRPRADCNDCGRNALDSPGMTIAPRSGRKRARAQPDTHTRRFSARLPRASSRHA
jgi:hypothetical protein